MSIEWTTKESGLLRRRVSHGALGVREKKAPTYKNELLIAKYKHEAMDAVQNVSYKCVAADTI